MAIPGLHMDDPRMCHGQTPHLLPAVPADGPRRLLQVVAIAHPLRVPDTQAEVLPAARPAEAAVDTSAVVEAVVRRTSAAVVVEVVADM